MTGATREIVLLGAGHTNVHVIRLWRTDPIPGARLTCVSDHAVAAYSGMLAGTLAGQYESHEMEIDLARQCALADAQFVQAKALGLDPDTKQLRLEGRSPLAYDLLSIGVGSRPAVPEHAEGTLSIKPMQTFLARLQSKLADLADDQQDRSRTIAIVGGGAAGVEIANCLDEHLRQTTSHGRGIELCLVEGGTQLLHGMPQRTNMLAHHELQRRQIRTRLNARVAQVEDGRTLILASGERLGVDLVVWATVARPSALLSQLNLPLDERGFLSTRDSLQCSGYDDVFAVGDTGSVDGAPYAKAGVYAVRQGPILWENLRRRITGQVLLRWRPQSRFLSLLNTGEGKAILTYGAVACHTRWAWWLKDWIDRRFMGQHRE
ncbi:MAG: FAD-dependent oxidoreductase [Planctomycetota bacterium]